MKVNVYGAINLTLAALPLLRAGRDKKIITTSSTMGSLEKATVYPFGAGCKHYLHVSRLYGTDHYYFFDVNQTPSRNRLRICIFQSWLLIFALRASRYSCIAQATFRRTVSALFLIVIFGLMNLSVCDSERRIERSCSTDTGILGLANVSSIFGNYTGCIS